VARGYGNATPASPPVVTAEVLEFYDYAVPNSFKQFGSLFRNRVDVLLVGFFLRADAGCLYTVALFLSSLIAIPLVAYNQLLPPMASRLHSAGQHVTLNRVYSTVTRLVVTITLLLAIPLFVYRQEFLAVFGDEYTRGALVLATFVGGRIVGHAVGATGWLFLMTDHQYLRMANSLVLAVLKGGVQLLLHRQNGADRCRPGNGGLARVHQPAPVGSAVVPRGPPAVRPEVPQTGRCGSGHGGRAGPTETDRVGVALIVTGVGLGVPAFLATLSLLGIERRDRLVYVALQEDHRALLSDAVGALAGRRR